MRGKFGLVTSVSLALLISVSATAAQAQNPSIAAAWGDTNLSHDECLARARAVFQNLKYTRIESIRSDTFADWGRFQFGIRCVPEKQQFFVYGGGPGNEDKRLIETVGTISREFQRK